MLGNIWDILFVTPLLNALISFYKLFGFNLGLAIISLSIFVKLISFPFTHTSLKTMKKQRDLMPEVEKLKKKYGHDKKKLAEAQLELYKQAGINPASGCLTQIFPILVAIALFSLIGNLFNPEKTSVELLNSKLYFDFLRLPANMAISNTFGYLDLSKRDPFMLMPIIAAFAQFLTSKMMMPEVKKAENLAEKSDAITDDVMYNMQEQMLYTMPVVFLIAGWQLPSGVVLNILVTTLFSLVQQYYVHGLGGLKPLIHKLGLKK